MKRFLILFFLPFVFFCLTFCSTALAQTPADDVLNPLAEPGVENCGESGPKCRSYPPPPVPPGYCVTERWWKTVGCEDTAETTVECIKIAPCVEMIKKKAEHIFNGPSLDPEKDNGYDDNKDGKIDINDLLAEIKEYYITGQQSAITIAGVVRDGVKTFIRGDVNGDGLVDAKDNTYYTAWYNHKSNPAPKCMDAADTDDNGQLDSPTTFAANVTNKTIRPPYPTAGNDTTGDDLTPCGPSIATMLGTTTTTTTTTVPPPSTTRPPQ